MTAVTFLLTLGDRQVRTGFAATNTTLLETAGQADAGWDPIFQIDADLDRDRWDGVVIHHSAEPAGDAASLDRLHRSLGRQGLGYHFLIGNGNGLGNGTIHVGHRWNEQLPGAHTGGPQADQHNRHKIGICLIGNGDRRQFTPEQLSSLVSLVQRLQRELDFGGSQVVLHRDAAPDATSSPGRFFPEAMVREQLAR